MVLQVLNERTEQPRRWHAARRRKETGAAACLGGLGQNWPEPSPPVLVFSSVKGLPGEVISTQEKACQEEVGTSQRQYCQIFIYQNEENDEGRSFDSQQSSLCLG